MTVKAALFDFDGTLMDTEPAIMASFRYMFSTYRSAEDFTPEVQLDVLGPSLAASMRKYFPERDTDKLVNEYRDYQRDYSIETIVPMKNCLELIAWLKEQGYKIGLVSSRRHDSMEVILNYLKLGHLFDILVGDEELQNSKPHPEGIQKAMHLLKADKAFYVGDSPSDILAGKNAGIPAIAYISNDRKKEAILQTKPDLIIQDLMEVKDFCLKEM